MRVKGSRSELRVVIEDSPAVNRHKPSVDVLFESVKALGLKKVSAAILTGMGADGAKGLLSLRQSGARTFSQDEASCVVYGMPREAVLLGGSETVLPLSGMAGGFLKLWRNTKANRKDTKSEGPQ